MPDFLLSMLTATMLATQAAPVPARPAEPAKKDATPPITLSGCISQDAEKPGSYTFADAKTGAKYRLSGVPDPKNDVKKGEFVVGGGSHAVTIRGGLVPSANVAGQAGAIDPSKAAIASAQAGASNVPANIPVPEFRATSVQAGKGSCPP